MSDISYVAPPPPPPPPPPTAPRPGGSGFDFVKPFTFLFQDPRWLNKVLIGGLFYLASIVVVGIFFVLGYAARLARNVVAGVENPAPEWDDLGDYFGEGLVLAGVVFVYCLPLLVLACVFIVPAMVAGAFADGHDLANGVASAFAGCSVCFAIPIGLVFSFWIPAALLFAVIDRRFGAAFEFGRIYQFITSNFVNYLLAFLVFLVARFAVSFGLLLFCVGIFFTAFWALVTGAHAFAQAWRLSQSR